ncbi:MAG: DUF1634 domain-containing protein [Chloroflexota bacterium]
MARQKENARRSDPLARPADVPDQPATPVTPASRDLELAISQTLRYGVLLSALLVSLGLLLLLAGLYLGGGHPTLNTVLAPGGAESLVPRTPGDVWAGLLRREPNALVDLGLLVLIGTPVAGLLLSALQFLRERDYRFVAIALALLVITTASFFLGARA